MKTWLVTGASGFLGANAAFFLNGKAESIGLVRTSGHSFFPRTFPADLTDLQNTKRLVHALKPDVILHTAAMSSHESCEIDRPLAKRVNADLTGCLAESAAEIEARFIYISTDAVFDGQRGNYAEGDTPNPFSTYGETKLLGEIQTLAVNSNALVIRTNFFGWSPNRNRSILEFFVHSLRRHKHVQGYDDFQVSTLYVQDLLEAIWTLNKGMTTGLVHVGSRDSLSKYDFGLGVADVFNLNQRLIQRISAPMNMGISRNRNLSLDTSNFREITNAQLPSQLEGISRAFKTESNFSEYFVSPVN